MRQTLEERFWAKVDRRGADECWPWTAGLSTSGYPKFAIRHGDVVYGHRFSYQMNGGELRPGFFVCHRCDNARCVNPGHLYLGTPQDNMSDMWAKGRGSCGKKHSEAQARTRIRGDTHPNALLAYDIANEIRQAFLLGATTRKLAELYETCAGTIGCVIRGDTWISRA